MITLDNTFDAAAKKRFARKEWHEAHKAEIAWLNAAADRQLTLAHNPAHKTWAFPIDLQNSLDRYGTLTDGQVAAVRKCMARDAERAQERVAKADTAPAVDATALQQAFDKASTKAARPGQRGVWLKPLKLRAGEVDVVFSVAGPNSKNPGAIYAKRGEAYLGKIQSGKWFAARECTDADTAAIAEACADPAKAAVAYGKAWSVCAVCGRTLLNDGSIERGIGPICAERFGW